MALTDIWGRIFLHHETVLCVILIPDDCSSRHQCDEQTVSRYHQMSPGGQNWRWLKTSGLEHPIKHSAIALDNSTNNRRFRSENFILSVSFPFSPSLSCSRFSTWSVQKSRSRHGSKIHIVHLAATSGAQTRSFLTSGAVNIQEFYQWSGDVLVGLCLKQNPSEIRGRAVNLLKMHFPHRSWVVTCAESILMIFRYWREDN